VNHPEASTTGPKPVKVRYISDDLHCTVQHVVGHSIRCPRCKERHVSRTPHLARTWLYAHRCDEVVE
jgi:hypothetical protein